MEVLFAVSALMFALVCIYFAAIYFFPFISRQKLMFELLDNEGNIFETRVIAIFSRLQNRSTAKKCINLIPLVIHKGFGYGETGEPPEEWEVSLFMPPSSLSEGLTLAAVEQFERLHPNCDMIIDFRNGISSPSVDWKKK